MQTFLRDGRWLTADELNQSVVELKKNDEIEIIDTLEIVEQDKADEIEIIDTPKVNKTKKNK